MMAMQAAMPVAAVTNCRNVMTMIWLR